MSWSIRGKGVVSQRSRALLATGLFSLCAVSMPVEHGRFTIVSHGSSGQKSIALTFDAGADRGYAAKILGTLERYHVPATFGVTGQWAAANPSLVRRMNRDRDVVMNHTYDHRSFTGVSTQTSPLSVANRTREISEADAVIKRLTGHSTKPYFRPPFGDYDSALFRLLPALGYRYMVMWTVDSLGWEHLPASQIFNRCLKTASPGEIVLMHVGIQSQDALALGPLISALRARGYHLVTIAQITSHL